ncbi:MAG: hypothetical protein LPK85_04625, partial [Gammaproteobacteria bacterium]|nr:hypothetical protein [Gammaproteobacteria bacterium]
GVLLALGVAVPVPAPERIIVTTGASVPLDSPPAGSAHPSTAPTETFTPAAADRPSASVSPDMARPDEVGSRTLFKQLLRDYRSGEMAPDDERLIENALHDLNQHPLGRSFIIETFFSSDEPYLAEALYGLMLDADLKDLGLLEALIQRDRTEFAVASKMRLLDLIADLSAQENAPYSAVVDDYLAQMALSPDPKLQNTAAAQRIWYLAHHQPDNLAALDTYLLDTAPLVREEMYSLIESRMAHHSLSGQAELTLALNAALHADYLGVSATEKARVSALLAQLSGGG